MFYLILLLFVSAYCLFGIFLFASERLAYRSDILKLVVTQKEMSIIVSLLTIPEKELKRLNFSQRDIDLIFEMSNDCLDI